MQGVGFEQLSQELGGAMELVGTKGIASMNKCWCVPDLHSLATVLLDKV